MNQRFGGLYTRLHGPLPTDTDEFGLRAKAWQEEYERRTSQPVDGIVSDNDLRALRIPVVARPVLFTVQGTGQPDPLGPGLPADTARQCLDKMDWQGIGNYPATAFPEWPSIMQGCAELNIQIDRYSGREINLAGYSQGAVVVGQVLKHDIMNPQGRLHHRLTDVRKVVFWGNPMRQQGIVHFDEWIHPIAGPDTHGILDDRLKGLASAPFQTRDYAHDNDMYASVKDDEMSEYQVAIGKIVMRADDFWNGPNSLVSQIKELLTNPLFEGIAMFQAISDAIAFFTSTAHGYNIGPAIAFLRS